jgi:hypothetical protein
MDRAGQNRFMDLTRMIRKDVCQGKHLIAILRVGRRGSRAGIPPIVAEGAEYDQLQRLSDSVYQWFNIVRTEYMRF